MNRLRVRGLIARAVLASIATIAALLAAEGLTRVLIGIHVVRPSLRGASVPPLAWSPRLVRSDDPELFVEWARDDPLINASGFRGPDVAQQKPAGTSRLLILGDSVAFGLGVPYEDTLAAYLAEMLNAGGHWEVLDLAVNGYGTPEEVALLRKKGLAFSPDVVLLVYVVNDPVPPQLLTALFAELAERDQQLLPRLARHSELAGLLLDQLRLREQGGHARVTYERAYEYAEWWNRVPTALAALAEISRTNHVPVVVALFPLLYDLDRYPFTAYHGKVRAVLEHDGLPYLDLAEVLPTRDATAYRIHPLDDTHPNARGHREAAAAIYRFLVERGLAMPAPGSDAGPPDGRHRDHDPDPSQ